MLSCREYTWGDTFHAFDAAANLALYTTKASLAANCVTQEKMSTDYWTSGAYTTCCRFPNQSVLFLVAEFYEEILSLVYSLTCQSISGTMWEVFATIHQLFKNDGFDYFTGEHLVGLTVYR